MEVMDRLGRVVDELVQLGERLEAACRTIGIPCASVLEPVLQKAKDAKNGQIVVARLGEEVTVKRFRRNKHLIELHPENPDYQTIVVEPGEPFEIEGLAVGLIRNTMLM